MDIVAMVCVVEREGGRQRVNNSVCDSKERESEG